MLKIAEKILNNENPSLCFFGDSVTHGEFEFKNGFKESEVHEEWVFHTLLKKRIKTEYGKDIRVINAGIGGNFSSDGLSRIQRDVIEKKPDFCCVMFGTNDVTNARKGASAIEEYRQNLRKIVEILQKETIETVLMTPGMLCSRSVKGFGGSWWFIHKYYEYLQNSGKMDHYVEAIREIGNEMDVPVADAYKEWQTLKENGTDTTALLANGMNHPSPEMHKVFSDKLFDLIFEK